MKEHKKKGKKKRFFLYMGAGGILALLLCTTLFALGNDRYGLIKPTGSVVVAVTAQDTPRSVGEKLHLLGAVGFPRLFAASVKAPLQPGEYTVEKSASYAALARRLCGEGELETVTITFAEGLTVPETVDRLVAKGIGERERFYEVINTYPFSFAYLPKTDLSKGGFRLEGYLYPDTYEFYKNSKEEAVIEKFLRNFEKKFDQAYAAQCEKQGLTVEQAVILGSMVQAEARDAGEFGRVASVFRNRLASKGFPYLESDATVAYALTLAGEERGVEKEDLSLDSPYNTYRTEGLPPGGICSPSKEAIAYAICPQKTDYFYFVADPQGQTHFSKTYAEHRKLIRQYWGGRL